MISIHVIVETQLLSPRVVDASVGGHRSIVDSLSVILLHGMTQPRSEPSFQDQFDTSASP